MQCSEDVVFYAHSGNNPDKSDWEPLADHLSAVCALAEKLASAFGAGPAGGATGALHDVGKATLPFQRRLEGGKAVDHSTAGAKIALARYGGGIGKLMAYAIAGHHAGLANGARSGGGSTALQERLDNAKPFALPDDCDLAPKTLADTVPGQAFPAAFWTRMLFSALIDSDRLASEAYDAKINNRTVERGWGGDLAGLRDNLNAYLDGLRGKGEAVDDIRCDILAGVRIKATTEKPGLFSLTVPTGGGKTLSSLAFALDHMLQHDMRRVIYVAPFTSVVEQTADVFRTALKDDDAILEHHSAFDIDAYVKGRVGEGENDDEGSKGELKLRNAAQNWDRPVIVTTAVQFFDSLFSHRPSACRKLHNIAKSVVVLDEAQTIPLKVLRPCLAALQELARAYGASIVLCTATQPAVRREKHLDNFKHGLKGVRELAPDVGGLFRQLDRVRVTRLAQPLPDDDLVARLAAAPQALCIVNNRRHARDLFRALREAAPADEVFHLSTCMCAAHRRAVLATIKQRLRDKLPARVAATSLVEAGVDFSFPTVYRAMAGLESIAQAAGRCNRSNELAPEKGQVFVFDPAPDDNHKPPRELKQFGEIAEDILKKYADPLAPETVRAYFKDLYWTRGPDELDGLKIGETESKGVLNALDDGEDTHTYPFADIGEAFKLIDSPLVPIIIPYDSDRVQAEIDALENAPAAKIGRFARNLQPFTVQIPRGDRAKLLAAGAVKAIRPKDFGDQFLLLENKDLYSEECGLDWSDPDYLNFDRLWV